MYRLHGLEANELMLAFQHVLPYLKMNIHYKGKLEVESVWTIERFQNKMLEFWKLDGAKCKPRVIAFTLPEKGHYENGDLWEGRKCH